MTKISNSLINRNVALFLVFTFITTSMLVVEKTNVFADVTTPYITTLDSERVRVTPKNTKIYSDTNATVSALPSGPIISKVTNLKSAITTYKDNYIAGMSVYEDNDVNLNTTIDDQLAIVDNNNTLITGYRNSTTIPVATSSSDLTTKINAATGSITVRIADLSTNSNLSYGSTTKSVTLIVDNLTFGSSNKSITVYGNLIVLNSINLKSTTVTIKKTNALTDGNFYIDKPTTTGSNNSFTVGNMLYLANDFSFDQSTTITAGSLICGMGLTNNSSGSSVTITNGIFIKDNLTANQRATFTSANFTVNGDLINYADGSTFNATNVFFANSNILLNEKTNISASNLTVDGSVTNSVSNSTITITNTAYIYSDLKIDKLLTIHANDLVVDGSIINSANDSHIDITDMLYVENDFILNQKASVTAYSMFVGVNLYNYSLDQNFDIQRDIFVSNATFAARTKLTSHHGDLIINAALTISSEIEIDIAGRMAVGGNITYSGNSFKINTGGETTAVLIPTIQEPTTTPTPMPSMTPTPTESPISTQDLIIKLAQITSDTTYGNYLLTITYKRLVGVFAEQIIIKDASGVVIKTIDIDPAVSGVADTSGYVTFTNQPFSTTSDNVSISVKGSTKIVTYVGGGDYTGTPKEKPYFTTNVGSRISVPNLTSTIYVDHSAHTTVPNYINVVDVKFLKKAISDYGKYFKGLKHDQYEAYEDVRKTYNNRTMEQIEAIIAADTSDNIVIETEDLNLTKDIVLGSAKKSVTLIVENLTVNSPRNIEIFGNLIVKSNFNANQALVIKTNKVNGVGGNFYTNNVNYNGATTLNIANMLYATSLTMQQASTITAGTIVVTDRFTNNATSQITVANDIYAGSITCNQAANITVTSGDLVVRNDITANNTFSLNVGGRVCVGKRVTISSTAIVWAGTKKTALIFVGEERAPEVIVVVSDSFSKPIGVDLQTANSPFNLNQIANFNNNQVYFAGDTIYYKVYLPDNFTNMILKYSLNQSGQVSIFDTLPNTNYYAFDTTTNTALQADLNTNNLAIAPISVSNQATSYIIKAKLKHNISAPNKMNKIDNTLTLNYINIDGANVIITKKFTTLIVSTSGLRLN